MGEVVKPLGLGVPGVGEAPGVVLEVAPPAGGGFPEPPVLPELPEPELPDPEPVDPPVVGGVLEGAPEKMSFCAPKKTPAPF